MHQLDRTFRVLFCLIWMFFVSGSLSATTMHAVIFAGTDDFVIGPGNQVSYQIINSELDRIHQMNNGIAVKKYPFIGSRFNVSSLADVKNQLKAQKENLKDDVIFFIFIGHGFNQATEIIDYPNLVFLNTNGQESETDIEQNSISLQEIVHYFEKFVEPRLLVAYAEACNNNYLEGEKPLPGLPQLSFVSGAGLGDTPTEKQRELFVDTKGVVVFTSSSATQPSYVSSTDGGVYTQSFVKALQLETSISGGGKANFQNLFTTSRKFVQQIANEFTWEQTPQLTQKLQQDKPSAPAPPEDEKPKRKKRGLIAWLVGKLAPNKVKKGLEVALEEKGNLLSLSEVFPINDAGDRMRRKMYAKNPVMYFVQEAMVKEEQGRYGDAYTNYSIAYGLWRDGYFTKNDLNLIDVMKKKDEDNLTGIREFSSFEPWLKDKTGIHEERFQGAKGVEVQKIENYKAKIKQIDKDIEADENTIDSLLQESKDIRINIEKLDVPRVQNVEVKLKDIRKLSNPSMRAIQDVIKNGQRIGADSLPNSTDEVDFEGNASVKFKYGKRRMNSDLRPAAKGYKLGTHCNEEIVSFTTNLMELLLAKIDEVPQDNLKDIIIKLNITGHADWVGGNGKIIRYRATTTFDDQYKDKNGDSHSFYLEVNESTRITNTELAFLRGHCAYDIIRDILLEKGILEKNIEVYFTAIAWDLPAGVNPKDRDAGKDYRGVEISTTIKNLYKHYVDEIERLEKRLEKIKKVIEEKKEVIAQKRGLVKELEAKIKLAEEERDRLQMIIDNANVEKDNGDAKIQLEQVKEVWNR